MKIIALMCVRSEAWVLAWSARVALQWVDALVVLDHASSDGTPQVVARLQDQYGRDRVSYLRRDEPDWPEMGHREALLCRGRELGGTHLALIDADEVLTANWISRVRGLLSGLEPGAVLEMWMVPVWQDLRHFRTDDCVWTRAYLGLGIADGPGVMWAPEPDGYCHHSRTPRAMHRQLRIGGPGEGGVMHLQFVNRRRLIAKHVWYRMMEHVRWPARRS